MKTQETIEKLIHNNDTNKNTLNTQYEQGYFEGYHDALVDLLNELKYKHNHETYQ